jgi:hypothetical protein
MALEKRAMRRTFGTKGEKTAQ